MKPTPVPLSWQLRGDLFAQLAAMEKSGLPAIQALGLLRFSGEPQDIARDIRAFAAIGVHELIFDCRGQSIAQSIERLEWFATDVIPLVDG